MARYGFLAALVGLGQMLSLAACGNAAPPVVPVAAVAPAPPPPPAPAAPDPSRFHALLLNGGANPNVNYQPHLLHLRALRDVLLGAGLHADQIAVFSSDGADPAPDLMVRDAQPEADFWLLRDTRVEHALETPRHLVSSEIPGVVLQPARKAGLVQWFATEGKRLRPGDTLLLYVTDHGNRSGPDPSTNTIALWGDEQLSVVELRDLIRTLPPGVRVVSLMSQCFSGGFAELSAPADAAIPATAPDACGYFSSTPDRMAYGCFAENVGKERVGHSFHFIRELAASRSMTRAHDEVLVADDTPDVPLRSSDAYLEAVLQKASVGRAPNVFAFADGVLGASWRQELATAEERDLVDRIAAAYGLESPPTLAQLEGQYDAVAQLGRRLEGSGRGWKGALTDAVGDNLQGFLAVNSSWNERLSEGALKGLDDTARRGLSASLLADLGAWTRKEKGDRLETIDHKSELVEGAGYRTEVRVAATLRLRVLLVTIAGRAYLARSGTQAERDHFAALRACEDMAIPALAAPRPPAPPEAREPAPLLPSLASDDALERATRPAWIGILFSAIHDDLRKEHGWSDGASLVTGIYPGSPAKDAGLEVGDVILGPPDHPFTAHNQIRAWTMLSPPDQPGAMRVVRGGKPTMVTLVPRTLPLELSPIPPPTGPEVGAPAPPLPLRRYRGGDVSLHDGRSHLLLFWATWCGPCKASLPEVLAYERAHHTQVIAVTNEPKQTLDAFFKKWALPFPKTVAIDDFGTDFGAYGIGATPGFVLIDGKGIVRARATGYSRPPGLPIDGWKWDGK